MRAAILLLSLLLLSAPAAAGSGRLDALMGMRGQKETIAKRNSNPLVRADRDLSKHNIKAGFRLGKVLKQLGRHGMTPNKQIIHVAEERTQKVHHELIKKANSLKQAPANSRLGKIRSALLNRAEGLQNGLHELMMSDNAMAHEAHDHIAIRSEQPSKTSRLPSRASLLGSTAHEIQHAYDRPGYDQRQFHLINRLTRLDQGPKTPKTEREMKKIEGKLSLFSKRLEGRAFQTEGYMLAKTGKSSGPLTLNGSPSAHPDRYPSASKIAKKTIAGYVRGAHDAIVYSKVFQSLPEAEKQHRYELVRLYLRGYKHSLKNLAKTDPAKHGDLMQSVHEHAFAPLGQLTHTSALNLGLHDGVFRRSAASRTRTLVSGHLAE